MRDKIMLRGKPLGEEQYREIIKGMVSLGYKPSIDPREFDTPLSIKVRFKTDKQNIRFIEFSPDLELSLEHELSKIQAKNSLKELKAQLETMMVVGNVSAEDYEKATLEMISKGKSVLYPKDDAEKKLFEAMVDKKIFTKVFSIKCGGCDQAFFIPVYQARVDAKKLFCRDCKAWTGIKGEEIAYVVNEEYMDVMDSVWNKVEKVIKKSWEEVLKHGVPVLPK